MPRKYISKADKETVRLRANYCCEYCQSLEDFATEPFSIEHIIPLAKGGLDELTNLALACLGCNSYKHIKTEALDADSKTIVLLFHPREHDWTAHFEWSENFTEIIGKTAIGRATVVALKLNRKGLVNLRMALTYWGEHPPKHSL